MHNLACKQKFLLQKAQMTFSKKKHTYSVCGTLSTPPPSKKMSRNIWMALKEEELKQKQNWLTISPKKVVSLTIFPYISFNVKVIKIVIVRQMRTVNILRF